MRILIVGCGGLIGSALVRAGVGQGLDRRACDVTSEADRERVLREHRPDAVLFCAAATHVDQAGAATRALNVEAPRAWSKHVETWFLSSNFVFDGEGPHAPAARPRPGTTYAEQKVEAEAAVLANAGHVVRVGWVFGPGGKTFASTLASRLRAGQRVSAICDVVVQPTHANDVARALADLPRGTSHLIGRGETSWYGMACAVRAQVGRGSVVPVRLAELGIGPRPRDARLFPATLPAWYDRLPQ